MLRQSRYDRPGGREKRFELKPRVACRNKWRRIERLQRSLWWEDRYGASMTRWRAGDREVVFPEGTYRMRVLHGVNCADMPESRCPSAIPS